VCSPKNSTATCGPSCIDCTVNNNNVASHTCNNGVCGIGTCIEGFANCDKIISNGCELDLNANNLSDCGVCKSGYCMKNGRCQANTNPNSCGAGCVDCTVGSYGASCDGGSCRANSCMTDFEHNGRICCKKSKDAFTTLLRDSNVACNYRCEYRTETYVEEINSCANPLLDLRVCKDYVGDSCNDDYHVCSDGYCAEATAENCGPGACASIASPEYCCYDRFLNGWDCFDTEWGGQDYTRCIQLLK
jgi:hypothetical protein